MRTLIAAAVLALAALPALAQPVPFEPGARYELCTVPGGDCTKLAVETIGSAKRRVLVLAFSFTSPEIASALAAARRRGVAVEAVLDHSNVGERTATSIDGRYSIVTYLRNAGIPVRIDRTVAIAHNKTIVVDEDTVLTGSFNFTRAAQTKNAENMLVLHGVPALAKRYADYFASRRAVSQAD